MNLVTKVTLKSHKTSLNSISESSSGYYEMITSQLTSLKLCKCDSTFFLRMRNVILMAVRIKTF